jgi:hypothetical protein
MAEAGAGRAALAIDQSFPTPLVNALDRFLVEVELFPLRRIDNRLNALEDRELLIALHQLGWKGLVTATHKMLRVPATVAALLATRMSIVVVDGVGDDPLRATGALLLALPDALRGLEAGPHQVVGVRAGRVTRMSAWELFARLAEQQRRDPAALLAELRVSDEEMADEVLALR